MPCVINSYLYLHKGMERHVSHLESHYHNFKYEIFNHIGKCTTVGRFDRDLRRCGT